MRPTGILNTLRSQLHVSRQSCSYIKKKGKVTSVVAVGLVSPLCLEAGLTHVNLTLGESFDRGHRHHQKLVAVNTSVTAKTAIRPAPVSGVTVLTLARPE